MLVIIVIMFSILCATKNDYTVALETDPLSVKIIDTVTLVTSIFTYKLLREGGIKRMVTFFRCF